MAESKKITRLDLVSVFMRSFFIQAVWNFKGLLSTGFCYTLVPAAKRLTENDQDCAAFLKKHLCFFNAHPYFASYAVGAIIRLEKDLREGGLKDEAQIERFKNAMIGALGALGDQLFWAAVKPGAILLGLTGAVLFDDIRIQIASIVIALIVYNIPHLYVRAAGLMSGYSEGYAIVKHLKIEKFVNVKNLYLFMGAAMLGIFSGYIGSQYFSQENMPIVVFGLSIFIILILKKFKVNWYLSMSLPIILAILLGML